MNLYFRLFCIFIVSMFKSKKSIFDEHESSFRVYLNDLDLLFHMNNGRYFTIADLARYEMIKRSGLLLKLHKQKIFSVMAAETMQFRKPLFLFQRFKIKTRLVGWDHRFFYLEHKFVSKKGIHNIAFVKIIFLGKNGERPKPSEILELIDIKVPQMKNSKVVKKWNDSLDIHWEEHKGAK